MVLVGLAGPFVAPPVTAVLLSSVSGALAGTASGVFNTCRQVGGALAVAVFGDAGRHARTTIGVPCLPGDAATEVEGMFVLAWGEGGGSFPPPPQNRASPPEPKPPA